LELRKHFRRRISLELVEQLSVLHSDVFLQPLSEIGKERGKFEGVRRFDHFNPFMEPQVIGLQSSNESVKGGNVRVDREEKNLFFRAKMPEQVGSIESGKDLCLHDGIVRPLMEKGPVPLLESDGEQERFMMLSGQGHECRVSFRHGWGSTRMPPVSMRTTGGIDACYLR
jgi:hypothetical protein